MQRSESVHRLELRGLIPSWVVDRLTCVLGTTQSIAVRSEPHPLSHTLNWSRNDAPSASEQFLSPTAASNDAEARRRGCWTADEDLRWRGVALIVGTREAVPSKLECRTVREVTSDGCGSFHMVLASRGLD